LGYISEACLQKIQGDIKPFTEFKNLSKEIVSGFAPSQVRAAFKEVKEFALAIQETIPDSEFEAVAAAMWQVSTVSREDVERGFKKTSAAFAIFGEELVGRLDKLQFTEFAVVGTHKPSNEHLGRKWVMEALGIAEFLRRHAKLQVLLETLYLILHAGNQPYHHK
jgi:hypothetical protein